MELSRPRPIGPFAMLRKLLIGALALVGLFWLVSDGLLRALVGSQLTTKIVRKTPSPDGSATAEIHVTRGGLGTVWTTRVLLRRRDESPWTVYEAGDNAFTPPLRWLDRSTLQIGLPCGKFDHLSNPDDWEASKPRPERLRVRFQQPSKCP
jgi:hypothetical protein